MKKVNDQTEKILDIFLFKLCIQIYLLNLAYIFNTNLSQDNQRFHTNVIF